MIGKAGRFWRTVRHLRPVQVYGRLVFRLSRPRPETAAAPPVRRVSGTWRAPARRRPSLVRPTRFRFLNAEADLAEVGWDDARQSKLWRYNQHYFEDLTALDSDARAAWHEELIAVWIQQNPPGAGTGWEPYPTSLRIINWIKWTLAGGTLSAEAIHSLAVQTRWLMRRIEWHLLGNHLFINAKALMFAGLFFDGAEADAWRAKGIAIIAGELDEQFLADGGQFELSPMYHALGLEDLLDLANLGSAYGDAALGEIAARVRAKAAGALSWLAAMSHPDGKIAFFNDAAFGIAPANTELSGYASRLGITAEARPLDLTHLSETGYVRMERGPIVALIDVARIGPDYLPGHAHADTLSFELSFAGQRLFVNSGTSEYGTGAGRQRQRGTATHNCVIVAGENSSEIWGGFRVGRRAYPKDKRVGHMEDVLFAEARHDGYRHLHGSPSPFRRFLLADGSFTVEDQVNGAFDAEARYHLHPAIVVHKVDGHDATLRLPDGTPVQIASEGGALRCEPSECYPEFGVSEPSSCLVLPLSNGMARFVLSW